MDRSISFMLVLLCVGVTVASYFAPELLYFAANGSSLYAGFTWQTILPELAFYQFLHGGILHLVSNAIFLIFYGPTLEQIMGNKGFIWFFLVNTVFVYVALLFFSGQPTIGISGFCMAVLAYLALYLDKTNHPQAKAAFFMLGLNVFIGFTGSISLIGHAAGAIFGGIWYVLTKK